jgi:hypothetical protein
MVLTSFIMDRRWFGHVRAILDEIARETRKALFSRLGRDPALGAMLGHDPAYTPGEKIGNFLLN